MSTAPPSRIPAAPPLTLALVTIAAAGAIAALSTLQAGLFLAQKGELVPWIGLLKARIVDAFAYALFVMPLWWLVRRYPLGRGNWRTAVPLYLVLGIAVAFTKEVIYVAIGDYFRPGVFHLKPILMEDFSSELLTSWALIGLVHAAVFHVRERSDARPPDSILADPSAHISVRARGGYRLIGIAAIEHVEAEGNYARLVTADGSHLLRETMTSLERRLGPRFVRIHRRRIVNLDHVQLAEPGGRGEYRILLRSGARLTSARSFNAEMRAVLRPSNGSAAPPL